MLGLTAVLRDVRLAAHLEREVLHICLHLSVFESAVDETLRIEDGVVKAVGRYAAKIQVAMLGVGERGRRMRALSGYPGIGRDINTIGSPYTKTSVKKNLANFGLRYDDNSVCYSQVGDTEINVDDL